MPLKISMTKTATVPSHPLAKPHPVPSSTHNSHVTNPTMLSRTIALVAIATKAPIAPFPVSFLPLVSLVFTTGRPDLALREGRDAWETPDFESRSSAALPVTNPAALRTGPMSNLGSGIPKPSATTVKPTETSPRIATRWDGGA